MFDIELHYEDLLRYAKKLTTRGGFLLPEDLINECYANSSGRQMDINLFKHQMLEYYKKEKRNTYGLLEYDDGKTGFHKARMGRIKENKSFAYAENIFGEEWSRIENVDGNYFISNKGRVKSRLITREKILIQRQKEGYLYYTFKRNGIYVTKLAHRLVGLAFCPNQNNYAEMDHLDEDKTNNDSSNLEWVTHAENMRRYFERHPAGFDKKEYAAKYNPVYYLAHKNNKKYKESRNRHSANYYQKNGTKAMSKYLDTQKSNLTDAYIKRLIRGERKNRGAGVIITNEMISDKRKTILDLKNIVRS